MLLKNKIAVIYGGGGAVGAAVAHAFAREGARVFLAGRTLARLYAVAREISGAGGTAEIAEIDALDKQSVDNYLDEVIKKTGHIDISFNAIGLDDEQGTPLMDMQYDYFALPVAKALKTHFITATAATHYMAQKGAGVIMAITANAGHQPYPNVGGFGIACAAIEAFCRQLAVEAGKDGIRVICLRSTGSPDAPGVDEVFNQHARNAGLSRKAFEARFVERTMLKRLPSLSEVANAAALMASDGASAITAAVTNITCGAVAD